MSLLSREWVTCPKCGNKALKSEFCMWCGTRLGHEGGQAMAEAAKPSAPTPSKTITYSYNFNLVLLGDVAVGKTSIIKRYTAGQFTPEYYPTFESTAYSKIQEIPPFRIELGIWDTGGGLPSENKAASLIGGADAILMVFEVSRRSSFTNLPLYYDLVRRLSPAASLHVAGNKVDLGFRQVRSEEAEQFSAGVGASYTETSAVLGTNIEKLFNRALKGCLKMRLDLIRREMQRNGIR